MIVVTGASRGLGKAVADRFSSKGERVICLSRSPEELTKGQIQCDVSDYSSVKNAARIIKSFQQPVRAVINSAGVASMNLAITTDETTIQTLIQTNLVGTIYCCKLFAPMMLKQRHGCFINFSTIAVPLALKGESVYAASKAGVESFTRTFAREISNFNVRANCIAPGPIKTDLLKGISQKQIDKILSQQVIQKQFVSSDVCDMVELLLDEKSFALSGQVLNIGGV